ncbi:uncharacterized protein SOCE836_063450 [Sorangium cellulosum]|uniref:HTH tetR-type domain-containing protein n=1 Tax=Sorangium cellulosum TaxID=56 RepID=A0A4P2QVI8_SORCE|nr:uncharacterized protein SOCE836_063450 [Sorangium cellulosum]
MGRPRKAPQRSELAPREQILEVAGRLFAERGVVDVSMLEIAQAAGLRQSSLYYWFRRKELIVAEILQQVNRLPLSYARRLEASGGAADVQLWRFVRFDVETVCGFPLEITEIHRFNERDPEAFATYWAERRALTEAVAAMIGRGVGGGDVPRGGRLPVRADGAGAGRERAELVPPRGGRAHPSARRQRRCGARVPAGADRGAGRGPDGRGAPGAAVAARGAAADGGRGGRGGVAG